MVTRGVGLLLSSLPNGCLELLPDHKIGHCHDNQTYYEYHIVFIYHAVGYSSQAHHTQGH